MYTKLSIFEQTSSSVICEEADDTWSSCNSDADKGEGNTTSTPVAPKLRTKRRLAAQFAANWIRNFPIKYSIVFITIA